MGIRKTLPRIKSLSNILLLATIIHLSVATLIHVAWLVTGNAAWLHYFFAYQDPVFLVSFSMVGFSLSLVACHQFSRGQSLRMAWMLISLAAACHMLGTMLSHLFATDSYFNPLYAFKFGFYTSAKPYLLLLGQAIAGPLNMAILACGLLLVLQLYRGLGLLGKLKGLDWGMLGLVSAYSVFVAYTVIRSRVDASGVAGIVDYLNWSGDPLLCLLLFESIWIRRSLVDMGWGFVSKCWGSFVAAIFLTSMGSMGKWATAYQYIPWPQSSVTWYVWYLASAAFALAPAFQVEASITARARLRSLLFEEEVPVPSTVGTT